MNNILNTPRLRLRPFKEEDLPYYHAVMSKPEVGDWLDRKGGFTLGQTKELLEKMLLSWETRAYGPWAMIEKARGKLLGHCGFRYSTAFEEVELLYALDPDYWGKGFTTEATRAAVDFGIQKLNLRKIISFTQPHNLGSRRVMEKVGFHYVRDIEYAGLPHVYYELIS